MTGAIIFALFVIAVLQGYNWSINARVEAGLDVLKRQVEALQRELNDERKRNGR